MTSTNNFKTPGLYSVKKYRYCKVSFKASFQKNNFMSKERYTNFSFFFSCKKLSSRDGHVKRGWYVRSQTLSVVLCSTCPIWMGLSIQHLQVKQGSKFDTGQGMPMFNNKIVFSIQIMYMNWVYKHVLFLVCFSIIICQQMISRYQYVHFLEVLSMKCIEINEMLQFWHFKWI